jgi:CubicO group peptidase (beta-lactamase class C family)
MDDNSLVTALTALADSSGFSGVVRIDRHGSTVHQSAHGMADRAHGIPMTTATRIAVASGAKGFTALTVMALVERGSLALDTTARSLLGGDLPLVDDRVTIVDLLAHRSGIGDYINEDILESVSDYIMPIPVHRLASAEDFVVVLDGFAQVSAPGEKFAYNNSGFVLLAVLAERAAGRPFHDLVDELVIGPAGLQHTGWERSDELPGDVALGYLDTEGQRTNVLHLPVLGTGDGGIATTADDMATFWAALFAGRIVSDATRDAMTRRVSVSEADNSYGLGFWLHSTTDAVMLEGYDAGASFRSSHRPSTGTVWSVLANTSEGAWPLVRLLSETLDDARDD